MAKQIKLVDPTGEYVGEMKSDVGGRAEFVGKKSNRVRSSVCDPEEIDQMLDNEFNPVKEEIEQPQPEQPKVKTTTAYDNSRLEFLRMQIGPVQNFYQTLGNILYSLSIRLDVAEAKVEVLKAHLDQTLLERELYKRYLEYCQENKGSGISFIQFVRTYAEEEEDEAKSETDTK